MLLHEPVSAFSSPLTAIGTDKTIAGITHGNRYHVRGLSTAGVAVVFPLPGDVFFASGFKRFGGSAYSEDEMLLSMGRSFGDNWSGGISMHYRYSRIERGDMRNSRMNASLAIRYRAGSRVDIGFRVKDLFVRKQQKNFTKYGPVVSLGMEYHTGDVQVSCVVEKSPEFRPSVTTALRYQYTEKFCIMSGVSTGHSQFGFGFRYDLGNWSVTCAGSLHQVLGISHNVSINLSF
jgi:hypothetical protein